MIEGTGKIERNMNWENDKEEEEEEEEEEEGGGGGGERGKDILPKAVCPICLDYLLYKAPSLFL